MSSGAMFSFAASVEATCILIAATIFNGLYPLTLPTFPGMPFIIMAVFTLVVLITLAVSESFLMETYRNYNIL